MEREGVHIQLKAAVVVQRDELLDFVDVARLAIGRHAHDLIFAVVHAEAEKRRKRRIQQAERVRKALLPEQVDRVWRGAIPGAACEAERGCQDRKSTRLNSSHVKISYAVFCLNKKKNYQ